MEHAGYGFVANLDHEQRVRYYEWWRKYRLLKRISWIALVVYVICWIVVLGKNPLAPVARLVMVPVLFSVFGSIIWLSFLDCPRCGETFRGWNTEKYFGEECQNCGLSAMQLSAIAKPQ